MNVSIMLSNVPGVPGSESRQQKSKVLAELLRAEGHDITEHGVRQWFIRNSIPGDWLARVTALARKRAPRFDPFTFTE
jgi:hypothetical protein